MRLEEEMAWRKWNVIVVLILANYVVFGLIAAFVFPVKSQAPLIHTAQPTFTPGTKPLQRVGTLTYDFLTPSPSVRATTTSTRTPIAPTATPTEAATTTATSVAPTAPSEMPTLASTPTPTATSTAGTDSGTATLPALLAPRPLIAATPTPRP
jgi:hypothetical protein